MLNLQIFLIVYKSFIIFSAAPFNNNDLNFFVLFVLFQNMVYIKMKLINF